MILGLKPLLQKVYDYKGNYYSHVDGYDDEHH